jgi:hypothetical protein
LGTFALGLDVADSIADEYRIDAGLDRRKLAFDPPVDLADLPCVS